MRAEHLRDIGDQFLSARRPRGDWEARSRIIQYELYHSVYLVPEYRNYLAAKVGYL